MKVKDRRLGCYLVNPKWLKNTIGDDGHCQYAIFCQQAGNQALWWLVTLCMLGHRCPGALLLQGCIESAWRGLFFWEAIMDNLAKLHWLCRRGTLELDLLLCRYLLDCYPTAGGEEKRLFEELLQMQDSELLRCLFGGRNLSNVGMSRLVDKIRKLNRTA